MAKKDLEAKKLADINKIKKKWDLFWYILILFSLFNQIIFMSFIINLIIFILYL
jgi:hypothetical protein